MTDSARPALVQRALDSLKGKSGKGDSADSDVLNERRASSDERQAISYTALALTHDHSVQYTSD